MEWFNAFGLAFIAVIMIPNIIFAVNCKEGFENRWKNKAIEIIEQIGRFGFFCFMIFNVQGTWFGWWSDEAFTVYLIIDTLLIILYYVIWAIYWKKISVFRALALSVIPSVVFLFSGVMSRSILLILSSVLFAPSHILISYKNAKWVCQIWISYYISVDVIKHLHLFLYNEGSNWPDVIWIGLSHPLVKQSAIPLL